MITYSIIQKSQLEGALRLDAEYYQPEYLNLLQILMRRPHASLKDLVERISRGKQPIYKESGNILAFTSDQIRNDFIDTSTVRYTDEMFYKSNPKAQVRALDVLLNSTGVGTLGRVNFYYLEEKAVVDSHITIIRVIPERVNPIFLNVFLKTKYGQLQITRAYTGSSGQIELYPEQIKEFLIFLPSPEEQSEIAEMVKQAINLHTQSEFLYSQAEDLLLEELGLKDFKIEDDLSYIVNLSEIKSAHRADAEYFQPKYEKIISKIKCKIEKLANLLLPKGGIRKGIEIGSEQYQEEGKLFIRVSNLSKHGLVERDQKYLSEELYQKLKKDFEPKVGEILLTKDATPGIAYFLKEPVEGIIAGGILRLKLKSDINPEYLALVINSIVGQIQVERDTGGSVIFHWRPDQIKNLLIPILSKSTQQKIADLVQKSYEARKKAKQLLEEAKRKVEKLIEDN